jgi:hypothetical protein
MPPLGVEIELTNRVACEKETCVSDEIEVRPHKFASPLSLTAFLSKAS